MNWDQILKEEYQEEYFKKMMEQLNELYQSKVVYPCRDELFTCFDACPYEDIKVVVIGQDPYHQKGQAHGLSFSVKPGVKIPPSLRNIYKELHSDLGIEPRSNGDLRLWAKQGVLLLNAIMSVEESKPGSHKKIGWNTFSDHILMRLNNYDQPLVFFLWGNFAIEKASVITNPKHLLIKSAHPSPLSAYQGFFGSKPFSQANKFLKETRNEKIDWSLEDDYVFKD